MKVKFNKSTTKHPFLLLLLPYLSSPISHYFPISVLEPLVFETSGLKNLGSSLTLTYFIFCALSEVSKTTLRISGLLKEFMGLRITIILMVMVCCSQRIEIKIRKNKDALGKVQEKPSASFQKFFSSGVTWMHLILCTMMGDNMCKALPTREAPLSLGVQDFYWGSIM